MPQKSEFVHLHNHSEYSLLDGACRISDMVDWAIENSSPAIALTDHGNMFGAYEFYTTAKAKGVNPIVGCEVYVAPTSRSEKNKNLRKPYHLTLLAKNESGYKNLLRLVSIAYIEGFYHKPRIDMEIFREYSEGIIALTGCINGFVPALIGDSDRDGAIKNLKTLIEILGKKNLYVEIQNHGLQNEKLATPHLIDIANEFELKMVGTNDSHYLTKSDHDLHDVLLCIQMNRKVHEAKRMTFENQFYLKTVDEMYQAFNGLPSPQLIGNSIEIANRCQLELSSYGKSFMPEYKVPEGFNANSYLKKICYDGLLKQFGSDLSQKVERRINYELSVIEQTGYAGYFLIVWDYVNYARSQNFPLNARGSAGGSLVLYALGVTTFDPMEYDCIFERFLNLERVDMPDIDIDFAPEHRDLVIQYLMKKYGAESVGYVATFNTMGAKQAIKDVGRALDIPLPEVDRITKLVPSTPGITLDEAIEEVPELQAVVKEPENERVMKLARSIEGMKRHASIHASGIVLANGRLAEHVPLFKDKHHRVATQFDLSTLAKVGMVKFDFLGLRTLSEVYNCIEQINARYDCGLHLEDIPFDNKLTYKLISAGLVAGLFQLETSPGMRRIIMQISPDKFDDFTPIPALYRPGPLDSGMMDSFIRRKTGREKVSYLDPILENALRKTYGVCIYQEQVMQIAQDMAGFTLGEADLLRYAMGKKKAKLLQEQKDKFIAGSVAKGISERKAIEVFEYLEPFGRYAFNRSHTVAYAILSYRMAFLKANYPHEFMASMMTGESANKDKMRKYINECEELQKFLGKPIGVLPPDVNSSNADFTVHGDDIRFGLMAVTNVSDTAISSIVEARDRDGNFKSFQDFCERVNTRTVNKRVIETLIKVGAFDSFDDGYRAQYMSSLDRVLKHVQGTQKDRDKGQELLFGGDPDGGDSAGDLRLDRVPEWSYAQKLAYEKELLGLYISGHPLKQYGDLMKNYSSGNISSLTEFPSKSEVSIVASISEVRKLRTKAENKEMAVVTIEDMEGSMKALITPNVFSNSSELIETGKIVWMRGILEVDNRASDDPQNVVRQLRAKEIIPIDEVVEEQTSAVEITISDVEDMEKIEKLKVICKKYSGKNDLVLRFPSSEGEVVALCDRRNYKVRFSAELIAEVEDLFGKNAIKSSNITKRPDKSGL